LATYASATGKLLRDSAVLETAGVLSASGLAVRATRPVVSVSDPAAPINYRLGTTTIPQAGGWLANASYDGVNVNADDITAMSSYLQQNTQYGNLAFFTAPATANPRAHSRVLLIDNAGSMTLAGSIIERNRTTPMGEWITIPYSAGLFTGSGSMTWTVTAGGVTTLAYMLIGRTAFVFFNITGVVGGTASSDLYISLPFNPTISSPSNARIAGTTAQAALAYFLVGSSKMGFQPFAGGNHTLQTMALQGMAVCQV